MKKEFYAHTLEGKPPEEWQRLEDHLKNVAELARYFADAFGVGDWDIWRGVGMIWENIPESSRRLSPPRGGRGLKPPPPPYQYPFAR